MLTLTSPVLLLLAIGFPIVLALAYPDDLHPSRRLLVDPTGYRQHLEIVDARPQVISFYHPAHYHPRANIGVLTRLVLPLQFALPGTSPVFLLAQGLRIGTGLDDTKAPCQFFLSSSARSDPACTATNNSPSSASSPLVEQTPAPSVTASPDTVKPVRLMQPSLTYFALSILTRPLSEKSIHPSSSSVVSCLRCALTFPPPNRQVQSHSLGPIGTSNVSLIRCG